MPRRALRCIVDLQLKVLSAPGVWLPSKEDLYLSVSLFNQYRNTRLLTSIFPLIIAEKFCFEKTYYTAVTPSHVSEMLADELVIFELVQLSEYTDGAVRLGSYSTNARDFLYPYTQLTPSYSTYADRELLLCRTIAFPGIAPKLEFITKTIIKESVSPELDALDDALYLEGEYRTQRKARKARSPSPSFRRKLADISLTDTIDPRPPFVIRKLDRELIGRKPGNTDKLAKSKPKRSASPYRSRYSVDDFDVSYNAKPGYRLSTVIRDSLYDPLPVFKTRYSTVDDEIDNEVAALTALKTLPSVTIRPRSVSPLLYRTSFKTRYGDTVYSRPYSPTYYDRLIAREAEMALERRLGPIYGDYYNSLDDLELDLRLAKIRAGRYY